jgi:hypothetical protein
MQRYAHAPAAREQTAAAGVSQAFVEEASQRYNTPRRSIADDRPRQFRKSTGISTRSEGDMLPLSFRFNL